MGDYRKIGNLVIKLTKQPYSVRVLADTTPRPVRGWYSPLIGLCRQNANDACRRLYNRKRTHNIMDNTVLIHVLGFRFLHLRYYHEPGPQRLGHCGIA